MATQTPGITESLIERTKGSDGPTHITFPAHGVSVVTCLLLRPGRIISSSDDHTILVHSPTTGELLKTLDGHEGGVWSIAVFGDTLVSGSTDRTLRVWNLKTGCCTHVFESHTSTVRCVSIVEPACLEVDGKLQQWPEHPLIVTGSRDNTLRVWTLPLETSAVDSDTKVWNDVDTNPFHRCLLEGHTGVVRALDAHGRTAVSASYDCTVRVWDIGSGECKRTMTGHSQKVYSVVYDPKRQRAYSGSMDGTARIWNLTDGTCEHVLEGHTSLVGLLALSSLSLVSASADSTIRLWDPISGALRHTLLGHTGAITCFQHDEYKVLSGSDGSLKMWDTRTGTSVKELLSGVIGVWQVAFDGQWCVAASNRKDATWLDIWDFGSSGNHGWFYDAKQDGRKEEEEDNAQAT